MKEYNLYLDESYDKEKNKYLIAGFAIENTKEELLREKMHDIKEIFWAKEYIEEKETVLHCTELSVINHNRKNKELRRFIKRECYNVFISMNSDEIKEKMEKMQTFLVTAVRSVDVTVFGCLVDNEMYDYLYPNEKTHENIYDIGIQCILENYVHFLTEKNAVGNVIYESMNEGNTIKSDNVKMQKNFCRIVANNKGIVFVNAKEFYNRIRDFVFPKKNEENAGLELADFICFYLFKSYFRDDAQKSEFMKIIEKKLYNGNNNIDVKDVRRHFGLRVIPENIKYINDLELELQKVKRSLGNLKRDGHKMYEKNKKLIEEKRKVEVENRLLKEKSSESIDNETAKM